MVDDPKKPKTEMTVFEEMAGGITLNEQEKKLLESFKEEGVKDDAKGLPVIAPRIDILHQGAAAFKFKEEPEETQLKKTFNGILLHIDPQRAWWESGIGEGKKDGGAQTGQVPDCYSRDLIVPDPESAKPQAKTCAECRFNQFGSDRKGGRGKDCKEARRLFIQVEKKIDPHVMTVPATSLKSLKKYLTFISENNLKRPQCVLTKFSLITTANKEGTDYSELVLTFVKALPDSVVFMALQAKRGLEEMLKTAHPITKGDYVPDEPGSNG